MFLAARRLRRTFSEGSAGSVKETSLKRFALLPSMSGGDLQLFGASSCSSCSFDSFKEGL